MKIVYFILVLGMAGAAVRMSLDLGGGSSDRNGEHTSFYAGGGARETAFYVGSERQGPCRRWYADGTLKAEGEYVGGRMSGAWRFYTPAGEVDAERSGTYERDRRVGPR